MLSFRGATYKARKQYITPLELYYRVWRFSYLYFTPSNCVLGAAANIKFLLYLFLYFAIYSL